MKKAIIISLIFFLVLVILIINMGKIEEWDISKQVQDLNYGIYLEDAIDIDYNTPAIFLLAQEIKSRTSTPKQAIKETLIYVYLNVEYSSELSEEYCYEEKASTVLESGIGDCVSMSRLVTALLRAQGIPAKTVGGCYSAYNRCDILFSTIPYREAQVTPMEEGVFKKKGYLHEWVEVWEPENGWILVEATSAQIFHSDCNAYLFYHYDKDQYERCVITSFPFWNKCSIF